MTSCLPAAPGATATPRRAAARRPALVLAAALLALPVLAGCSGDPEPSGPDPRALRELSTGTLTAATLSTPTAAEPSVTIRGGSGEMVLSLADLERMPTVEALVYEPFVKQDVRFTGVRLEDLVEFAGLPRTGELHTEALNDYVVDLPLSVLDHDGVVVATRADGEPIALEDGGPVRVVFTDDHPQAEDESLWIWSLATVSPR